jgi:tRNA (mo5U34)-methyltransferase
MLSAHIWPNDMTETSVLDMGCNSGYFAVQCRLRGARKVVAVDSLNRSIEQATFISQHFGVEIELVNRDAHVFVLTTDERFDFIIFSRVFYHLRYPTLVFDRLAEMAKTRLIMLTEVLGGGEIMEPNENYSVDEKNLLESRAYPKLTFIEKAFSRDTSNWWLPNTSACYSIGRAIGLRVIAQPNEETFIYEPAGQITKNVTEVNKVVLTNI